MMTVALVYTPAALLWAGAPVRIPYLGVNGVVERVQLPSVLGGEVRYWVAWRLEHRAEDQDVVTGFFRDELQYAPEVATAAAETMTVA